MTISGKFSVNTTSYVLRADGVTQIEATQKWLGGTATWLPRLPTGLRLIMDVRVMTLR